MDASNASFPVVTVGFVLAKTTGADVKAKSDVATRHLGGEDLTFGPEHFTASDRGLRHPDLQHCAHCRSRLQLW